MRPPEKRVQKNDATPMKPAKVHPGFTENGVHFLSETPVTNPTTLWVWKMCRRIPLDHLTPCMVVDAARADGMLELFDPTTLGNWSTCDRFHLWPLVWSCGPVTRTLMHHGKKDPPWADEWTWGRLCDASEARHGHPSRFEGHHHDPQELAKSLVRKWPTAEEADMRERAESQLAKAREAGLIP